MGQAKIKQRMVFAPKLIEEWESSDCVNFSVALSRLTGWLLHVDWWSSSASHEENISVERLIPLRVYVADNHDKIFDVRGVKSLQDFTQGTIAKIARDIATGRGGVYTRYYDEKKLATLPLRVQPDELSIARANAEILANPHFLGAIPLRTAPYIPAYPSAQFTFGRCAAFAEAMKELTGLQPVALLVKRFSQAYAGTKRSENGYIHSVVLHADGMAEDSWGKATLSEIASRFGAVEFITSAQEHRNVVDSLKKNSHDIYESARQYAIDLIQAHYLQENARPDLFTSRLKITG